MSYSDDDDYPPRRHNELPPIDDPPHERLDFKQSNQIRPVSAMNRTGGIIGKTLNVEAEDLEEEVQLTRENKAEAMLREDNFKSLKTINRSRIYIENLVTGKFSRIRYELTEDEANVESTDEK